jgi:hypothetical protein
MGHPAHPASLYGGYGGLQRGPFLLLGVTMFRAAIFVDAGYLFAQGSVTLAGIKQPRSILALNITATVAELKAVAAASTSLRPVAGVLV